MQKKTKAKFILVIAVIAAFACCGITFAWFSGASEIDVDIDSAVLTNYFERGNGTAENPFVIHTPRHMYNLAWLQYMGMFNKIDGNGTIRQYYFEICAEGDEDCIIGEAGHKGISELDMEGWTLPPVGTPENPFVGSFNGNGVTIKNLTVSGNHAELSNVADNETNFANSSYVDSNNGCDIVGLFGVVGNPNGDAGTLNGHAYTSSVNEVKNVNLENITVKTQTTTSLIGIVAGYVNGNVSGVGVIDSSVVASGTAAIGSITGNISDYSTIGYCTEPFIGQLESVKISIAEPVLEVRQKSSSEDAGNEWGGSISMKNLYERLDNMKSLGSEITIDTVTTERHITNEDGTETVIDIDVASDSVGSNYVNYSSEHGGSATFYTNTQDQYKCLYSGKKISTYTKRTEYYTSEIVSRGAFIISALDGRYFMNIANGSDAVSVSNSDNGAKWTFVDAAGNVLENASEGYLRTRINDTDYYLNRSGNSLSVGTSGDTYWMYEDSNLFCSDEESKYFLSNENGTWTLETESITRTHVITDGNGNYLNVTYRNGTGTIGNTTNANAASRWNIQTASGGRVNISTKNGSDVYYLNYNNRNLALQRYSGMGATNATAWDCVIDSEDPEKYYLDYNNYYIRYNNGWNLSNQSTTTTYYRFKSGSNYMYVDESGNLGTTASEDRASLWVNSGNDYYTEIDGTRYYLVSSSTGNGGTVSVRTSTASSNHTWSIRSNTNLRYGNSGRVYVYYDTSSGQWKIQQNAGNAVTYTTTSKTVYPNVFYIADAPVEHAEINRVETADNLPEYTYVSHTEEDIDVYTPYTYVPLCADDSDPFSAKNVNTGYMVSGTYNTLSGQADNGDIRVSWFAMSNLNHALGQNNYDPSKLQVLTKTYKTGGQFRLISDDYNRNTAAGTYLNRYTKTSISGLGLEKYADSRVQLEAIIQQDTSRVYGLHFMDASISMDHIITIPYAVINGTEYTDYEIPEDCIDCNLPQKGFINFFAGSYYASNNTGFHNNDSFFSLNQIIRDSDKHITDIRTIKKVYADPNNEALPYMFLYSDGKYSTDGETLLNSKPSNYSLEIFDCAWIETPFERTETNLMYAMFYYEVPVNPGEYALGSVAGRAGAYMPYLDISTNAIQYRMEKLTEVFSIKEESYTYPKGIQVIESASSAIVDGNRVIDDKDSAAVAITGNTQSGGMNISRDGNTVTVTEQSGQEASYVGNSIKLENSSGNTLEAQPLHTTEVAVKRITENVHNNSENVDNDTVTEITVVTVDGNVISRTEVIREIVSRGGVIVSDTTSGGITSGGIDTFTPVLACQYVSEEGAYETTLANNRTRVPVDSYSSYGAQIGEGWKTVSDFINYINSYYITINNQSAITVVPTIVSGGFSGTVNGQSMTEWTKIELSAQ